MSKIQLAKTASDLIAARKRVEELETKLAEHEKRAAAESLLIDLMSDPRAPLSLKPSSVADFLEKRAAVEKVDIETAKLAMKMASSHGFEIGAPEDPTPLFQSSGSKADDEFTEWLLGSQG